jgi:hypothetical protein
MTVIYRIGSRFQRRHNKSETRLSGRVSVGNIKTFESTDLVSSIQDIALNYGPNDQTPFIGFIVFNTSASLQ